MDARLVLPKGTVLAGDYRIARMIGAGGFGITYVAEDVKLCAKVAIKEYYPAGFGSRDSTMSVWPLSDNHRPTFEWGRSSFLEEARTLARFKHPNIVRVTRVFEANATAYMAMEFEDGKSFEAWLRSLQRAPSQEELDRVAAPLLDALELLHVAKFLHRDIAPDNIIIRPDGTPVLLDFGAARRAVCEMSRSLTGIIKAGYSPQEQYAADGRLQGAWTDLYAFGATLYRAVAGKAPEEAPLRMADDRMHSVSETAKHTYRPGFLHAIDLCLRPKHSDRPRSVAELRPILLGREPSIAKLRVKRTIPRIDAKRQFRMPIHVVAIGSIIALVAGTSAGYEYVRRQGAYQQTSSIESVRAPTATTHNADAVATPTKDERISRAAEHAFKTGDLYHFGRNGVPRDYAKAKEAYEQAAAEGHSRAANALGLLYQNGLGVVRDYGQAREWFSKAADAGNTLAMVNMGVMYQEGWGVSQDHARARELFEKALAAGNDDAMVALGLVHERGLGVARDPQKARDLYEKAAVRGNLFGMNNLGVLYRDGIGVSRDYEKARELFDKAAIRGNNHSMRNIGHLYENGLGVQQDYAKAREWYERAAEAKQRLALFELAALLDKGKGGPQDFKRAAKLLLEAAKKKNSAAIANLDTIGMAGWNKHTRVEVKRELQSKGAYSGPIDDRWDANVRAAVSKWLAA